MIERFYSYISTPCSLLPALYSLPASSKGFVYACESGGNLPLALDQLVFELEQGALGIENVVEIHQSGIIAISSDHARAIRCALPLPPLWRDAPGGSVPWRRR